MRKFFYLSVLACALAVVSCKTSQVANSNASYNNEAGQLSDSRGVPDIEKINDPLLKERVEKIRTSLKQNPPVLTLAENVGENIDDDQKAAQELALKDERFLRETLDEKTKEPLFNEIFGIYPLRESDMDGPAAACKNTKCYRVEMYNFAKNLTTNAIADVTSKKVIVVTRFPDAQPDIPDHLTKLAVHISSTAADVTSALGRNPEEKDALMANTKTSLSRTRCERSQHLCVAPTYIKDDKALWAIVDLTDLALVGTRWTQVGYAAPASMGNWAISEKSLQNEVLTKRFCETTNHLDKNGWSFDYILTSSDGMRISDVKFNGKLLIKDAKLVDWHVSYSRTDNFGYSDAVGCPVFSQAAVVAVEGPRTNTIGMDGGDGKDTGFEFRQDFWSEGYPTPCNYYYTQAFKFFNDGSFRFAVASQGRGCGNDGMYRPVLRVSLADDLNNFAEWNGSDWQPWATEQWKLQDENTAYTSEGFQYRVTGADGKGFYLEPSRGQFGDGGRGDNAFLYVTRGHADKDEGDSDMTTIGPCCNTDYHQGPEKFIEPAAEPIANAPLVLWYVPQLKNDDRPNQKYCWAESVLDDGIYRVKQYPCYAGPMLRPTER
ncbi:MAG TPA: hypothetical protein VGO50_17115 [Pyrinomonadaceae bacterium]|jgi:hypothetical protein|nr:hypothetical protein [Pyrinomonadaceae bacterium]